jgi:hypothetical protein
MVRNPNRGATRSANGARARLGNYGTIVDSARLILHGGVLALSLYVLAYLGLAWLDMAGSFYRPEVRVGYLFRGAAWLLGPHPEAFWDGVRPTLIVFSHMIIEPLRVCLIASTVAYCLEQVEHEANELQQHPHHDRPQGHVHRRWHIVLKKAYWLAHLWGSVERQATFVRPPLDRR